MSGEDEAMEAARRVVGFDPTFPKYDEWNDDLTSDAQLVARALLSRRPPTAEGEDAASLRSGESQGNHLPVQVGQVYYELERARENLQRRFENNADESAGRSARAIFSGLCLIDTLRGSGSPATGPSDAWRPLEGADRNNIPGTLLAWIVGGREHSGTMWRREGVGILSQNNTHPFGFDKKMLSNAMSSLDMDTLKITVAEVKDGVYIGPDVSAWQGHIEIAAELGRIKFSGAISARGKIFAQAGSGIEAGWGIEAGRGIVSKWLSCRLRIFAGLVNWRLPEPGEDEIRAEIRGGTVALGTVVAPVSGKEAQP